MLTVYHSNDLEILKALTVHLLRQRPLRDPFAAEEFLVQSTGMGQWLRQQLACDLGIAARLETRLPAQFIWDIYRAVLPGLSDQSAYGKSAMTWKLMALLPELLSRPDFAPLRQYLTDDSSGRKRFQLASRVADLFDQYLVYRPEWMLDWEQGGALGAETQPWQPELWRALVARVQQLAADGRSPLCPEHRAGLNRRAIAALLSDTAFALPERVFVFGISALPPQYLDLLAALGHRMDVHLMVSNPCEGFWSDLRDRNYLARYGSDEAEFTLGNPLLASFGKLGRDYLGQLEELSDRHLDRIGEVQGFVAPEADSLLALLQRDILHLEDRSAEPGQVENLPHSETKTCLDPADRSLQLHSCHSPMRELEVLQDRLLDLFDADPSLCPRDVIVMMPDVNAYAPAIQAVFASAPEERRIPVAISDRSARAEAPLLEAFLRLLQLPRMRARASELLELLELPELQRRFGLEQEAFEQLYRWAMAVNVRWGLDGPSKARFDLPEDPQNSWRFGFERLLAGYARAPEGALLGSILPYAEVEGLAAVPLGPLGDFLEALQLWSRCLEEPASPRAWQQRLQQLAETFLLADETEAHAAAQLQAAIEKLTDELQANALDTPLSLDVVRDWLIQELDSQRSSSRFLAGRVNFCTLMPMRAIPFKVVCLLGMNDGVYPRSIAPLGFDLIAANPPRRGDRSRREDDRYLFLEALLAAREHLYISYIGRSIQDNSERAPSVLVSELLEYVQQSFVLPGDEMLDCDQSGQRVLEHLRLEHPLQPFSPRYFDGRQARLFSYAREWRQVLAAEVQDWPDQPLSPVPLELVELPDLVRCARHPARFFAQERLQIHFERREAGVQDVEPFSINKLDAFMIRRRWLERLRQGDGDQVPRYLKAEGLLPSGRFGELWLEELQGEVEGFWSEKLAAPLAQPEQTLEIDLELAGVRLQGWVQHCYRHPDGGFGPLRYYASATLNGNRLQSAWLEHLALCAMGHAVHTRILALNEERCFTPLSAACAGTQLELWLALYRRSLEEPLAYLPVAALLLMTGDPEKRDQAVRERMSDAKNGTPGEWLSCPYLQRFWPDLDAWLEAMAPVAEPLWSLIADQLEDPDHDAS